MLIQQETSNLQSNRRPSSAYTHFEIDLHMRLLGLLALQPFAVESNGAGMLLLRRDMSLQLVMSWCLASTGEERLPGPLVMQKQGMILLRR